MNRKHLLLAAAALAASGCMASFSGDVRVDRETAKEMLADKGVTPFAELQLAWTNYPYMSPTESIAGETTVDEKGNFKSAEAKPRAADPEEAAALLARARKIYADAGLYDRQKGRGTLKLTLTTQNRWTYRDLFRSYLVETGFIFLLPSSLRTGYRLEAEFDTAAGRTRAEVFGETKTTFHLLLAPLYPFSTPGGKEKGLLRQMLWRTATDVYAVLRRVPAAAQPSGAGAAPAQAPEAQAPAPAPPAQAAGEEPQDD